MTVTKFLRTLAPDFMWCSVFDLFLMYEQIDEDVEWFMFKELFHQNYRRGYFKSKKDSDMTKNRSGKTQRKLYLRKHMKPEEV